jgi:hypothetical protein
MRKCPFCGRLPRLQLCDREGNHKPDEYANDPWSGLGYLIVHEYEKAVQCPIATHEGETIGCQRYDSPEEAKAAWNSGWSQIETMTPPLTLQAADHMAAIIDEMVRDGNLDSRSRLADARLDYGEPWAYAYSRQKGMAQNVQQ